MTGSETSMKRRTFLTGSVAAALAGRARLACAAEEAEFYAAAKDEGQVTWYTAHFDTQTAEGIGNAFAAKYPGIRANVVRTTAQVAFQRLSQDLKTGIAECDVFSSTDIGHYVRLKPTGVFLKYTAPNTANVLPAFKDMDPEGEYFVTSAGLICITYNKEKV